MTSDEGGARKRRDGWCPAPVLGTPPPSREFFTVRDRSSQDAMRNARIYIAMSRRPLQGASPAVQIFPAGCARIRA